MSTSVKMEFAVELTCQACVNAVNKVLSGRDDVSSFTVNLERQQVVVESTRPSSFVKDLLETTGKRAVLQGLGSASGMTPLGAAVSQVHGGTGWEHGTGTIQGVIRMVQTAPESCVVEGTVDGLMPGPHGLAIHENGDLSEGCESCGDVMDIPEKRTNSKLYGDLHHFAAGPNGRAQFQFTSPTLQVWEIIGRSMVIHDENNSSDKRVACGIVARSSGLFQNDKKICACDGIVLWDERDHPAAGPNRQKKIHRDPPAGAQL